MEHIYCALLKKNVNKYKLWLIMNLFTKTKLQTSVQQTCVNTKDAPHEVG